jgi:hypothetical protein
MQVVGVAGLAATLVVGFALGVRLLRAALRTRELPELCIGTASITFALAGVAIVSSRAADSEGGSFQLVALAMGSTIVGVGALAASVWRTFRPQSRWTGAFCAAFFAAQLALFLAYVTGERAPAGAMPVSEKALLVARVATYVWAAAECFHYHALLRRRLRLGLADPMIAHQIWLWGISATSMTLLLTTLAVSKAVLGEPGLFSPAIVSVTTPLALVSSFAIWFAFFPPSGYRRFIAARAAA